MENKEIEEARRKADVKLGVMNGIGPDAATTMDKTTFVARVNVDVNHPANAASRIRLLSEIFTSVLSQFPNMLMDDVIKAFHGAMQKRIWEDTRMGANLKQSYLSTMGVTLGNPYSSVRYEMKIQDYDAQKKEVSNMQRAAATNARIAKQQRHEDELREKYSYMDDLDTLTYEDLKEIDGYTEDLKGNVRLES